MKNNNLLKTVSAFSLLLIAFSVFYYFVNFLPKKDIPAQTLVCMDLWEKKKDRLFEGELGNYRVIYNSKLKTCLVGNIYTSASGSENYCGNDFIFVIDLVSDKNLLSFMLNTKEVEELSLEKYIEKNNEWDEALKKYEEFGLRVF
jgi:hypothetical protein